MLASMSKDVKLRVSLPNPNLYPQESIPGPTIEYKFYGIEACFVGLGLYNLRYHHAIRSIQSQLQPQAQPQMNMNESMPNNVKVNVAQGHTSTVRHGTGVFHPQPRSRKYRGWRNIQEADQRRRNASTGNDGLVMQEECYAELGLPKEWTY